MAEGCSRFGTLSLPVTISRAWPIGGRSCVPAQQFSFCRPNNPWVSCRSHTSYATRCLYLQCVANFQELIGALDQDQNIRGRQFEKICKWLLTHDRRYRRLLEEVWLWDEWPGRWEPDAGIDLVARHNNGLLWAVQAKAYNPDFNIKKADVDTFLSESGRPQFSYRLLIATTNRIARNALRTLEDQEKPAGLILRGDLEKIKLDWPRRPSDLRGFEPLTP